MGPDRLAILESTNSSKGGEHQSRGAKGRIEENHITQSLERWPIYIMQEVSTRRPGGVGWAEVDL